MPVSCGPCRREFRDQLALTQHLLASSQHWRCEQCSIALPSEAAYREHLANSERHNGSGRLHICHQCDMTGCLAYKTRLDLEVHLEDVHLWCVKCNEALDTKKKFQKHWETVHYRCSKCGYSFASQHNLEAHKKAHAFPKFVCYGCKRPYRVASGMSLGHLHVIPITFQADDGCLAMVAHWESGFCPCRINAGDVQRHARECFQSKHYTTNDPKLPFKCPCCNVAYQNMSSVMLHAETALCGASTAPDSNLGKFLYFLRGRIQQHHHRLQ